MDFTALELGLRNRQLLQVKCFLKIQIETFRYFLVEEFSKTESIEQQSSALEKFFLHDWQNVFNKISSVATIQMSGDYSSKIFSILLYRSLMHSCNQLILIISSISDEKRDGHIFIRIGTVSSFSSFVSTSTNGSLMNIVKEKILMILIKQINFMRESLSRIHRSETNLVSSGTDPFISSTEQEKCNDFELLGIENFDEKLSLKNGKFQEIFEQSLLRECIPLFLWLVKKYRQTDDKQSNMNNQDLLLWDNIAQRIVNFTSSKINNTDLNLKLVEQINSYLVQTGFPTFDLLFSLFIQTFNATIRQKLLMIFAACFNESFQDSYLRIISATDCFGKFKSKFGDYLQLITIMDMYIFCSRSRINDDEQLELSVEWVLNRNSDMVRTKSFLLPVLEEIAIKPNLFTDWEEVTGQIYNYQIFDPFRKFIFIEENFNVYINAEILWQYLIDNNNQKYLSKWIENDNAIMPFCSEIKPNDLETCHRMIDYLVNHSSLMIKYETFAALISNPYFFNQHDFSDLIRKIYNFQDFLSLIGHTNIFGTEICGYSILEKLLNKAIKLLDLIEYCIENSLFEFLFLLYNRYRMEFDVFFKGAFQKQINNNEKTIEVLNFLHGLCSTDDNNEENMVFEKSFFILRFLNGNFQNRWFTFKENVEFILKTLISNMSDLDLIFFMLTFSQNKTFDDFLNALNELFNENENSVKLFLNNLNSKYPLIHHALNVNTNGVIHFMGLTNQTSCDELNFHFPYQTFTYNIYMFLQQAIPFVNINKLFQWQIDRQRKKPQLDLKTSNQIENNELPHFSQKRLTELYGLKSNLTASYYIKNGRLIEAFLTFNNIKCSSEKQIKTRETRTTSINEKSAIKAIKKAAIIGYCSIKNDSIVTSCLLFQSLIKSSLSSSNKKSSKQSINDTFRKNISTECEKFRLHLAIGRLIIEYAADFLSLQNAQQRQQILASLLRRSHFNSDRTCSQKLLDLATIAIERKYSSSKSWQNKFSRKKSPVDLKLFQLFFECSSNSTDTSMVEMIKSCQLLFECFEWKSLFMFANFYSLKKPLNFLDKCTNEDNWLILTIFVQIYEISKEEIQACLTKVHFNNQCIGEHLAKAFQSSRQVNVASLTETDSRILKTKLAPNSSRNDLYSKLFKEKTPHPIVSQENTPPASTQNEPATFSLDNESPENISLFSSSMFSKISDENASNTYVVSEHQWNPEIASKDFLQLVLDIYQSCVQYAHRNCLSPICIETSFQITLLYASVSLSNPLLTLLACSLDRTQITEGINIKSPSLSENSPLQMKKSSDNSNQMVLNFARFKYPSFACWLLACVDQHSKQSYINWYCQNQSLNPNDSLSECFTNWSPDRLLQLINILTASNAKNFQIILQGLKMFEINIPILYILFDFLIEFLIVKDYYQPSDPLLQFQSLLLEYNEEEFIHSQSINEDSEDSNESDWLISDFYSKIWIEKCSLIAVINSMLIAKQFELSILLSHYNFVRIQDSFSSDFHRIPDIRRFYLLSQCLNKVPNYTLPIAELIQIETTSNQPEVHYGDALRKLIFDLQESGYFDAARNLINLFSGINVTNEFIINEWVLKAKQAELDHESSSIDLSFWENCWSQVTKLDPTMHSAFKVMERFVQQLEPRQILIKCFVLLKCLLAVETILNDTIENKDSNDNRNELSAQDDYCSTVASSNNLSNNIELIQDYFNIELSLWKSVVECEFYIETTFDHDLESQTNKEAFISAWKVIWKDIVAYLNSSIMVKTIWPILYERHPTLCKNVENQRNKQLILLEVFKHDSLNKVIGNLLDFFCYTKAKQVSKLFNYVHEDFEIIHACDQTARGILKNISDAPLCIQLKMKNADNLNNNLKTSISVCNLNVEQKKIISLLETFSGFATIGQKYCEYILLHYKISCYLQKTYSELKDSDYSSEQLLEMLLSSNQIETDDNDGQLENNDDKISLADGSILSSTLLIDKYMETIICAKEFTRVVGQVDEKFINEEKIVTLLSQFVFTNVQQIVDLQFRSLNVWNLSLNQFNEHLRMRNFVQDGLSNSASFTEIELDRTQLEFNSARFSVLIRLLREPYLLGHKLLELAKKSKTNFENTWNVKTSIGLNECSTMINSEKEIHFMIAKRKHYIQMVELYIRAHECFSAQCDVGGIALVLRKTRLLITQELQPARYFHLILRLLTGIGRYSEMTYCFDLFRECDRFELILSKRVHRTPQLRIALLNYLKNAEHIEELLPLVAIRFFLYRETADQHRTRAEKLMNELNFSNQISSLTTKRPMSKKLSTSSLTDSASHSPPSFNISPAPSHVTNLGMKTKEQLETIMYEFQEAETNYTKASSFTNADHCARMAQLIALQIYYINKHNKTNELSASNSNILSSVPIVINLEPNQVKDFVNQCNVLYEALIVAKSYPEVSIEWADPFFYNAIICNNVKYVSEFIEIHEISVSFLEKLIKRFELFSTLFRRQQTTKIKEIPPSTLIFSPSSPLPASFLSSLSQIRNEMELQKIYQILEQILECILCDETLKRVNITLSDKYQLAKKFNSKKLIQRLTNCDHENWAYLLDLKSNNNL